jgi:hypothetical protein
MKQTDKARSNNLVVDIVAVITLPEEYIVGMKKWRIVKSCSGFSSVLD